MRGERKMASTTDYDRFDRAKPIEPAWRSGRAPTGKSWYAKGVAAQRQALEKSLTIVDDEIGRLRSDGIDSSERVRSAVRRRKRIIEALDRLPPAMPSSMHRSKKSSTPVNPKKDKAKDLRSRELVPLPDEKIVMAQPPPRDGQVEFRKMVLEAYGACVVTGCKIEPVLEAAHIIPFVDARSHRIENALCLRSDIHALYDKGYLAIDQTGKVSVHKSIDDAEYRNLDGRIIAMPLKDADRPDSGLLLMHSRFVKKDRNP